MFLKNKSASGKFTFDIVYSCIQKSIRRNDLELSLEMVKEFKNYPNALKKRLIRDIYNTEPTINNLVPYVKIMCEHIKCREVIMGFRVACQDTLNKKDFDENDNIYTWCQKLYAQLCKHDSNCKPVLDYLLDKFPILNDFKIGKVFNFINKNRVVLYAIIAYFTIDYITNENYGDYIKLNKPFEFNFNDLTLPDYVYDKHVKISPESQKTYEFFMNNIVLIPRKPETELEIKGRELYITTNKASGEYISYSRYKFDKTTEYKFEDLELIQTQLITGRFKPRTWFCNDKVIKGPLDDLQITQLILSDKLKHLFGLKQIHTKVIKIDDKFYLMFDNLIPIDKTKTIIKSSKLETNVTIYNGDLYVLSSKNFVGLDEHVKLGVIKNLIFRKIIGTNDTCDKNIIIYNNEVASIDDPVLLQETSYMFKKHIVNSNVRKSYEEVYDKNKDQITTWLNDIRDKINHNNKINCVIKDFMLNQIDNLDIKF